MFCHLSGSSGMRKLSKARAPFLARAKEITTAKLIFLHAWTESILLMKNTYEAIFNGCYVARRYVQLIGENVQDIYVMYRMGGPYGKIFCRGLKIEASHPVNDSFNFFCTML